MGGGARHLFSPTHSVFTMVLSVAFSPKLQLLLGSSSLSTSPCAGGGSRVLVLGLVSEDKLV